MLVKISLVTLLLFPVVVFAKGKFFVYIKYCQFLLDVENIKDASLSFNVLLNSSSFQKHEQLKLIGGKTYQIAKEALPYAKAVSNILNSSLDVCLTQFKK
jgi:hypothetical protein